MGKPPKEGVGTLLPDVAKEGCLPPRQDSYVIGHLERTIKGYGYSELFWTPQTPSTMSVIDRYAQLLPSEHPISVIALADHQTQGIGREGRVWHDKPGCSILMSALCRLHDEASINSFADLVALRTCQALRETTGSDALRIKWPNDLVADDKKVGGILVLNIYNSHHQYRGTNVGIGINVHYSEPELAGYLTDYPGTSLDVLTGSYNCRQEIVIRVLRSIRNIAPDAQVINDNPNLRREYDAEWQGFSAVLHRRVTLLREGTVFAEGKVVDTEIGNGIFIENTDGVTHIPTFDPDMKVRIKT